MDRKLVIIPTYNERENIARMVAAVILLPGRFDLLVVDDGSPDGTGAIVRELQPEHAGRLHLLEREGKLGLGSAYVAGFRWALERDYEFVFEMDADFSHNPADLERLCAAMEREEDASGDGGDKTTVGTDNRTEISVGTARVAVIKNAKGTGRTDEADVVVGSRYAIGVNVVNWPMARLLISWCASRYVRAVTGMPVRDATAGFVGYRRRVLESIDLDAVRMRGYGFQIEMKYTAWRLGFTLREVSIVFVDRTAGTSKMSGGIFGEALWGVLALRFRRIRGRR